MIKFHGYGSLNPSNLVLILIDYVENAGLVEFLSGDILRDVCIDSHKLLPFHGACVICLNLG